MTTHHAQTTRILITAGPTHEPIDAVRYIGNRSSGRLGVALADEAAARGHSVVLLLGPTALAPSHSDVRTLRFRTAAELQALLNQEFDRCDVLIGAAAVADYTPAAPSQGKWRRTGGPLTLELIPTADQLAAVAARRKPHQLLVGFALEPEADLMASARAKLQRKNIDMIVANALETMDSTDIRATVLTRDGRSHQTPGRIDKRRFAAWLLDLLDAALADIARTQAAAT